MSAPTLVFIRHGQVGSRHFQHGEELPPSLLPREVVDRWLDERWLIELDSNERRSLYRLFSHFSGATPEQPMTREQLDDFCLPK